MVCLFGKQSINDEFGTMGYQAPEVFAQNDYDESIDCFSLGVLLYNFVTGQMPFAAKTQKKIKELTMKKDPSYKQKAWKQCSPELKTLVQGLLEKDPSQRLGIDDILAHPWITTVDAPLDPGMTPKQKKKLYLKRTLLK